MATDAKVKRTRTYKYPYDKDYFNRCDKVERMFKAIEYCKCQEDKKQWGVGN